MERNSILKYIVGIATRCFIMLTYLGVVASFVYADDFTKGFFVYSPKYVKQFKYSRQDPPFSMIAPEGWYMALRREEAPPSSTGAMFFKYDPEEKGKQGILELPYIRVDFFINRDIVSAIDYASQTVAKLKKEGLNILTEAEKIEVDGEIGSHFTTDSPFKGSEEILDNYIFVNEYRVIMISAPCKSAEFEEVKKEIRKAINSIKFRIIQE